MSNIAVQIEGKSYFVSLPTLKDWKRIQSFVVAERRRAAYAAIPKGLLDQEFQRYILTINDEVDKLDVFACMALVDQMEGGAALLAYCHLRRDNPTVTLDFTRDLVDRALDGHEGATAGLSAVQEAVALLNAATAKKNTEEAPTTSPSPSPST